MPNGQIEIFVHTQGQKPKVIRANSGESLSEVLARAGVGGGTSLEVFVGECVEDLQEPVEVEDGVDNQIPVDPSEILERLGVREYEHIHCHRCRHVAVEVNYASETKHRRFSPAATVEVVTKWAKRKFKLSDSAAADWVLQIYNTTERPRPNEHLGELIRTPECRICFDLVKEVTPQG